MGNKNLGEKDVERCCAEVWVSFWTSRRESVTQVLILLRKLLIHHLYSPCSLTLMILGSIFPAQLKPWRMIQEWGGVGDCWHLAPSTHSLPPSHFGTCPHLQSSKVVPGDANASRLRSSSLSRVTWRSWKRMVSRLSPVGRLSLMAGGGEDASPLTGEPAAARSRESLTPEGRGRPSSRATQRTTDSPRLWCHMHDCCFDQNRCFGLFVSEGLNHTQHPHLVSISFSFLSCECFRCLIVKRNFCVANFPGKYLCFFTKSCICISSVLRLNSGIVKLKTQLTFNWKIFLLPPDITVSLFVWI